MNREQTAEAIKVMQHYADGGDVEVCFQSTSEQPWTPSTDPTWNWYNYNYRPAQPKPEQMPDVVRAIMPCLPGKARWLAVDCDGSIYAFLDRPELDGDVWLGHEMETNLRVPDMSNLDWTRCCWEVVRDAG